MTLSDISINRPVFAWMLMLGLIVFGAVSLSRLGISQMPDVDFPVLNVSASWEGAAPEVMESEIADKLEQAVIGIQGIRDIISNIRQGFVSITIEFDLSRDIDSALQEVQSNISRVKLPTEVDPPTISKTNPDDQPILWLGISSNERSLRELINYIDLHIKDQFQIIPGVGEVLFGGYSERNLRIWIDNQKLKKNELTVLDVQNAIEQQHIETAAGIIENSEQELNLRVMGEGITPAEVANITLVQRGGRPIYNTNLKIGDIARVEDGLNDIRRISRVNGIPGLGLGIKKQRGANAVSVGHLVKDKVLELGKTLPSDVKIGVSFDSTKFIEDSVNETEFTLILSALVTALVCWLFLGSWSSTFNILLSIPTSIIGTFTVIYFMGFTLNFFTILGLALAVGIVVDDAIMVLENIFRHHEMGKDRVTAARDGAREITFAAIAASVAVIAIFLPVAFMKGIIGKFFFQFGVTISAAVALSLLEAITLTPMRASQLPTSSGRGGGFTAFLNMKFLALGNFYGSILKKCIRFRWLVVICATGVFAASLSLLKLIPQEFIPAQDQSMFIVRLQGPVGSSITNTAEKVKAVEQFLLNAPEVNRIFVAIGGFQGGEVNTAMAFVSMKPRGMRDISQAAFMNKTRAELGKIQGVKIFLQDLSTRGFTAQRGFPVEFNIRGGDWAILKEKTYALIDELKQTGKVIDVDTDYRIGMPEIRVWPDREKASQRGVSIDSIGATVRAAIGGIRVGKYTQDGRRYDVRIRLNYDERLKAEDIDELFVRNLHGELVPLKDVVRIETVPTLQTITRRNRERSISVFANVAPGASQSEALSTAQELGLKILPDGYRLYLSGGAQTFIESFNSLKFVMWLGVFIAYMVIASQFNSFIHPVTVLLALPFSVTGAFLALYLAKQSLNLYSLIGLVLLMGIVKKNSILLVEFANKKREELGLSAKEAMLLAAPIRLRPILMTTFATLAAALPPALALGPGAESRIPMSITVLGGVLVSTVFTLIVVPCAYTIFSRLERKTRNLSGPTFRSTLGDEIGESLS